MFIRAKTIKGKSYFYLVENKRHGEKVKQKVILYLGKERPEAQLFKEFLKERNRKTEKKGVFVENEVIDKNNLLGNIVETADKANSINNPTIIL
jgi:hypothetical protein